MVRHGLKTLHEDREVTRLGESVFQTGMISPEAMAETVKALKRFHRAVQAHVVDKVRVVATSAMRDARNAEAFREWVRSSTGWDVEVISGLEEGRLIHLGVVTHEPGARGKVMLIDLGGGSCEVTLSDGGRVKEMVSLPLGAVRLQQEFLQVGSSGEGGCWAAAAVYRSGAARGETEAGQAELCGVGATGDCDVRDGGGAGGGERGRRGKDSAAQAGCEGDAEGVCAGEAAGGDDGADVRRLADKLLKMTKAISGRRCRGSGRSGAEIIVGGAQVYAALLERYGAEGFRYSALGLRDGMLAQMLGEVDLTGRGSRED